MAKLGGRQTHWPLRRDVKDGKFDVVLTNPPFAGKVTGKTQSAAYNLYELAADHQSLRHRCTHWRTSRSRLDPTPIVASGKPACAYMNILSHRVHAPFGPPDALSFTSDHSAAVGTTWSYIRRLG